MPRGRVLSVHANWWIPIQRPVALNAMSVCVCTWFYVYQQTALTFSFFSSCEQRQWSTVVVVDEEDALMIIV